MQLHQCSSYSSWLCHCPGSCTHSNSWPFLPPPSQESPSGSPLSKSEVAASTHTALLLDFRASQHPALCSLAITPCQAGSFLPSWPLQTIQPFHAPFHSPLTLSRPKAFLPPDSFQHFQAHSSALSSCARPDSSRRPSVPETESAAALPCHLATQ